MRSICGALEFAVIVIAFKPNRFGYIPELHVSTLVVVVVFTFTSEAKRSHWRGASEVLSHWPSLSAPPDKKMSRE